MALRKYLPSGHASSLSTAPLKFSNTVHEKAQYVEPESAPGPAMEDDVDIDLSEVYFLIMHFLSAGPCHRTYGQFWNELLEHQLLPRRYHAWYSRSGAHSGDENDNGFSFPLSYMKLVERYPHVQKDHLVKLLKQLILSTAPPMHGMAGGNAPNAADVPTLLGSGSFSLLESDRNREAKQTNRPPRYLRWPHMQADQVRGLSLREIGGGFSKHHRASSIRAACYAIAKPSTMVERMQNIKKLRGHRDAVYCAILDRSGRYLITGSDDRLVKIWSMETAFCLVSCRGHEGDITDLAVSSNNAWVASASNDCIIRVWRLPDGLPIAVLRGHTAAVTAIAFSPRPSTATQLLSSSDDGTCRIWDIRNTHIGPRVYVPKPLDAVAGKSNGPSSSTSQQSHQILCCAYNANGTVFVTGSSDTFARVWNACKSNADDSEQPNHEMDVLSGHENDVNYVQFSGCAIPSKFSIADTSNEENVPKFKNSWFTRDNIVTCSRDGSAIIWVPKSRRSHSKVGRWSRAYHLKVPPPPMPPQPPRGGPRQRLLPTPRGVNMIVWSLDNRFVLAAIMDCRICVWNAADGSLVHSLTGHSESTYVLDVHPFNPRVAMSAGYDGKTIVWDIWEGTPIRIYEIGRFKLVDGKFSPDGTSIILSDDVGQIYILSTGQGESQKDAKYDQFFLGDYRTLMQDTHGTVLDQETQLTPYMRNIQDLLCDSSMMPYPEPYQSMYQQRRLGALGIDRRYSSVSFSVGPVDVNGIQDYQMLPLPDLDRIIEPLPEFIDAMDWEPENEVQSDDNDSEYNVTDEYQSEGEQGSLGTSSSGDSECSAEDSEVEHSLKDGRRRSKRKKRKEKVEFMTSSGRRVKRRNLDERDSSSFRINRVRKTRNGKKPLKRKPSTSKSLRPQRTAARNARHWLSRFNGVGTDEGLGTSEEDLSDGESMLSESDFQSNESDRSFQNVYQRNPKGKEASLDEEVKTSELECQTNARLRKRFVLKLPAREPKMPVHTECMNTEEEKLVNLGNSSSGVREDFELTRNHMSFQDPGSSSGNLVDAVLSQKEGGEDMSRIREQPDKDENHLASSTGCQDNKMKWGEVKARTSKRLRYGDASLGYNANLDGHNEMRNCGNGHFKPESECEGTNNKYFAPSDDAHESIVLAQSPLDDDHNRRGKSLLTCDSNFSTEYKDQSGSRECRDYDESLEVIDSDNKLISSFGRENGTGHSKELKEVNPPISIKFRIRPKTILEDHGSSSKQKSIWAVEDRTSADYDLASRDPLHVEGNLVPEVHKENEGNSRSSLDHGDRKRLGQYESPIDEISKLPILYDSKKSHDDSNNRMYNAVYKRSKHQARDSSENVGVDLEGSTSNARNNHLDPRMDFPEATADVVRRTRSMVMKATTREPDNDFKRREGFGSVEESRSANKFAVDSHEQLQCENWGFNSKVRVGLRSARNRRENYSSSTLTPNKRKPRQSLKKLSWLMLSEHEENYRYIPQLGDKVAYLRQGHEGYIEWRRRSKEKGPWSKFDDLKAVEFCKVEDLDYSTYTGSGESCCNITLEFVDPSSSVCGQTFKLTLPELTDYSDFLVEQTRYDASMNRNWTKRDKCRVWWREDNEEGGNWYGGRIVHVLPVSPVFPDSPWERYSIQYTNDTEHHLHSPWELHDIDTPWDHPHIEEEMKSRLLSSIAKLEQHGIRNQDRYGLQKLEQVSEKSDFLNRYPVPLTPELIQSRLENNYYRSLDAVKHDFTVMLSNAQNYFSKNEDLKVKLRRLSEWFDQKILPL